MPRRLLAAATFVVLVLACASPTLPLPPPEAPSQEVVDATHVTLTAGCGGAEAYATISVQYPAPDPNGATGVSTSATGCGSWQLRQVYAHAGDVLVITQQYGNTFSLPQYVTAQ